MKKQVIEKFYDFKLPIGIGKHFSPEYYVLNIDHLAEFSDLEREVIIQTFRQKLDKLIQDCENLKADEINFGLLMQWAKFFYDLFYFTKDKPYFQKAKTVALTLKVMKGFKKSNQ